MEIANLSLKFHADGLAEDTLVVRTLRGEERLAGPFRFELELVSREAGLDLDGMLYKPAKLGILQRLGQEEASFQWFQGVLTELEQLEQQQKGQWTRYRAVLAPDLVRLEECWRSRVFQALTTEELVGEVLKGSLGLQPGVDFEWSLTRTKPGDRKSRPVYPEREYVVQYAESDLDFVQRWLEQEGIWYQFDNDGTREKLLFADSSAGYKDVSPLGHKSYPYRPEGASRSTSGGEGKQDAEDVIGFRCQARRRPGKIGLDDYNWRDPQVSLAAEHTIHAKGSGVLREYNHHYKTPAQGATHAETRAQEWSSRAAIYRGESTCRGFRPGRRFGLEEHYRGDWNRDYLIVAVVHEAEQSINLEASNVTAADYKNSFECIPADLEFRPERTVSWPYIHGVMHARVDGEGDGQTADLDELGRYKVRIPWDENAKGAAPGKGSRRIRMSQPYAGPGSGLHFPLLAGTEVLLVHVDGDPDRPIIVGAIPDADTASPTNQNNPTQNKIQTPSGNMFVVDDHPDRSGFLLMDANRCFVQDFRCATSGAGVGGMSGGGGGEPGPGNAEVSRKLAELHAVRGDSAREAQLLREVGQAVRRVGRALTPTEELIAAGNPGPWIPGGGPTGGRGNEPGSLPAGPTSGPTSAPTSNPTSNPVAPTSAPTSNPTSNPVAPTSNPTSNPVAPTSNPTSNPVTPVATNPPPPPPPPAAPVPQGPPSPFSEHDGHQHGRLPATTIIAPAGSTTEVFLEAAPELGTLINKGLPMLEAQGADKSQGYQLEARRFGTLVKLHDGKQEILVSNVSTFHYTMNDIDVSISDGGGLSYAESYGGSKSTEIKHGTQEETVTVHGDQVVTTYNDGGVSETVTTTGIQNNFEYGLGDFTQTVKFRLGENTEFLVEGSNTFGFELCAAAVEKITVELGYEYSLNVSSSLRNRFVIVSGTDNETRLCPGLFMTTNLTGKRMDVTVPDEMEVRLEKMEFGISENKGNIVTQTSRVNDLSTRVASAEIDVSRASTTVSKVQNSVNDMKLGINSSFSALRQSATVLASTKKAAKKDVVAFANSMTAAIHTIQ